MTNRPEHLSWHECAALVGERVEFAASTGRRTVVIADVLPGQCVLVQDGELGPRAVHPSELI
ncbi:hypothetical protein [Nakamurella multipartita]|uniref:Uncharacterized protein n=1 Tax=Nakamurella multipartita (strain ATCC 700099 / DSM 44233 / CIP 104796 / JCM 9543 / NBRC 105858 / Y-104) TaxID=479431 RepID=C8X8N8_NAKMY|nr:hypothetical protein [Nakamurella multipartita]ACV79093.1 hypothetical protein Namu_2747 [Nakamurella multipartita DSM 44233]